MAKFDLMKKFYFLLFFCLSMLGFGQAVQLYNPADNVVYPNEQYFCSGEKFNLQVNAAVSSTGDYEMTSITNFTFSNPAASVPFSNKVGNDHFSLPLTIPFNFNFYGNNYTQVVVGSNGRLLFGSGTDFANLNLNRYVDKVHSGNSTSSTNIPLSNTPPSTIYSQIDTNDSNLNLNFAQIFMGFTDLGFYNPSYYDKIKYGTGSYEGVTGLLITFTQVLERTVGSGYNSVMDTQVLLLSDNRIIIKVTKSSTAKAILGIQNADATKNKVPQHNSTLTSDYNNGSWRDEGKSFLFTPNQNLTPVFKWTNNGLPVGTNSATLSNFTPTNNDVLKVEVTYLEDSSIVRTDEVTFKSLLTPIIMTVSTTCAQIDLETALIPNVSYEWRKVGNPTVLSTTNKLSVTASGDYVVKIIRNGSAGSCNLDSLPTSLVLNGNFPAFDNRPKFVCKTDGSTQTTVDLFDYYPPNPSQYSVIFQENGLNLPTPNNSITLNADQKRTIKVIVTSATTTAPCSVDYTFDLTFISLPLVNSEFTSTNLCFGTTTYSLANFENQYFAGKNYQFTYSIDGGTTYQNLTSVNPQNTNPVFVKIKHPNVSCETVVKLKFNFHPKVVANMPITQLPPQCASATQTFDLASLIPEINPDPNVTITFHNSLQEAIDGSGAVAYNFRSGMGYTTLYIRVLDDLSGCVSLDHPDITLLVYDTPNLLVNNISKANCAGNSIFDLTQNPSSLTNAQPPVTVALEYYSTNGSLLTPAQITNYDAAVFGQSPYIKVIYNPTCSGTVTFNLTYNPKPISATSTILICAEVNYSLDDFKNKVIANPTNYTFTDVSGNPLPANFNLTSPPLPLRVDYLIRDNTTGCVSEALTVDFVKGGNSPLDETDTYYTLCDADFDGKTGFNLDSKKSVFTSNSSAVFEYFKDVNFTQSVASSYTNEDAFSQPIYVRITIPTFCPSTAKINLIVNIPSKSSTLIDKYFICYGETLTIDAGAENTSWKWNTGETTQLVDFTEAGNYSVVLTNTDGCSYTHNFIISDENQPKIQVINQTNNSIEVIADGGVKPYTYYFNGLPQSSNILLNPSNSSYEIQVQSATGCFGPPKTVYFIKINNAFTPNGDGKNDIWKIDNLDKMEQVSIVIVDRNGTKVFESTNPSKSDWYGKQNGRALPTSTYWYVISWYDAVTQKTEQRQGWIMLKNRN